MKAKWIQFTCSNDESTKFNKGVFIIMNFNLMYIYINKNMVPTKTHSKKKNQWFIQNYLHLHFFFNKPLHWKTLNCIEKLLNWKIVSIEKKFALKNYFTYKSVAFKNILGTWCKLMYEDFPFLLENKLWKWL